MNTTSEVPDKDYLYGRFTRGEARNQAFDDKKRKFGLKVAHKAVDVPYEDDDMNIEANRTGIGALGISGIVAVSSIGPMLIAALLLMKQPTQQAAQQPTQTKEVIDNTRDTDIEVKSRLLPKE